jgi:hypothetical protein
MRPARTFEKLLRTAGRRISRLKARANSALSQGVSASDRDRQIGFVVIETQNLWSNFVRSYLLSLLAAPKRTKGGRVSLGNLAVTTPGALMHIAAKAAKGPLAPAPTTRRQEPPWHDINTLLRTCIELKPSNHADIIAAMSIQTRAFADLPTFRNFFAHRNQESAKKAIDMARHQYLITKAKYPTEALSQPAIKRPQALLLDWLDEISAVIELLCE